MSTLYIRLPPQSAADSTAHWLELGCTFALMSRGGAIEREGMASLLDLSGAAAQARRVVLLLAASDVTLLRVQVPPLPAAKLKAALPNLVEDRLVADPSGCAVIAGGLSGGLRTVAVVQRDWLDFLHGTLIAYGARRIAALPAQLCLPWQTGQQAQTGGVTAAISEQGKGIDMALRFSEQEGVGLVVAREAHEAPAREAIRALRSVISEAPITLYVPQAAVRTYQEAAGDAAEQTGRIDVHADNWPLWIDNARSTAFDLMAGRGAGYGSRTDWGAWRWPLALAAAVLSINAAALNMDWWRLKGEANSLRAEMVRIYQSAYPKETVIIDPVAQMRQKIAMAARDAGQPAPDDFTSISAALGEAWSGVAAGKTALAIASLEYRERSLFVRFNSAGGAPTQQMKAALAGHNLSLDPVPGQSGVVWQIRSAK